MQKRFIIFLLFSIILCSTFLVARDGETTRQVADKALKVAMKGSSIPQNAVVTASGKGFTIAGAPVETGSGTATGDIYFDSEGFNIKKGKFCPNKGPCVEGEDMTIDSDGTVKCLKTCKEITQKPEQGKPTKMDNAQGAEVKPDSYKLDHADSISDPQFDADDINNAYRTSVALATGRTAKLCTAVADTTMCLRNIENSVLHFTDSGVRFALTSGGPDGQLTLGQIEANFSGQLNVDVNGDRVNLTGENMSAKADYEVVQGKTSLVAIVNGVVEQAGIGDNSRYVYMGNGSDSCQESFSIYNPSIEWFQIYIKRYDDQYVPSIIANGAIVDLMHFTMNITNYVELHKRNSAGDWASVLKSQCWGNRVFIELNDCLRDARVSFRYDDINDPITYAHDTCLHASSAVLGAEAA